MHLHVARVRRNGKLYTYAQLVESYRREDGMPTQRIVAKLGAMSPLAIENLRTSLQAAKRGQRVVVNNTRLPRGANAPRPVQNLRYLDLAVLRELWCEVGLGALLETLMPRGESDVGPVDVVAGLVMQRCVDPGSKLYAERWFPRTALPELLGIEPSQFNNTRLHRVLDQLDEATEQMMVQLPRLYQEHDGAFAALFLDVTDTRFVGHGPQLAEIGKTKEGIVDRKIGIVLMCDQRGYPLRWQVVAGKRAETGAMHDVIDTAAGLAWVRNIPLVMDRAMGASAELGRMLGRGVHFVTALRVIEFEAYTDRIPHQTLAELAPDHGEQAIEQAAQRVADAGMQRVRPTLYVLDAGVVERDTTSDEVVAPVDQGEDLARLAIATSRKLRDMVQSNQVDSLASAARRSGLGLPMAKRYRQLLQLAPDLQQMVLDGAAVGLSVDGLTKISRIKDAEEQRRAFDRLLAAGPTRTRNRAHASRASEPVPPAPPLRVRAVISFNPERFVDERREAYAALDQVKAYVAALNVKLALPSSRRTKRAVERELDELLRRRSMLDLFAVDVEARPTNEGTSPLHARLVLDSQRWGRRRKYDGFSVIVAHPDVKLSAAELCNLYRAKDAVEKDFQIIKSLVRLRPIWHRTDAKVRAHVTICMLALLLERVLAQKLDKTSPSAALEVLAPCCLNRFSNALYVLTEPDAEQRALLRALKMQRLADEADLTERLRPRTEGQLPLQA